MTLSGWNLNRVTTDPDKPFPITGDVDLSLVEERPGRDARISSLWIEKTFPIKRDGVVIDRLHLLVRDHGELVVLDVPTQLRQWYLYSAHANIVIRMSLPRSPDALLSMDSTDFRSIAYFQGGSFSVVLTEDELAPLRHYLSSFDIWADVRERAN